MRNNFCTFALSGRMISGVDCWPKAMPLGYGLEGLSARIDCGGGEFCICENI